LLEADLDAFDGERVITDEDHTPHMPPFITELLFCPPCAENEPPFKNNTVQVALKFIQSGVLDRLCVLVTAVKRCHSGEAFVRLKVGAAFEATKP
jgi:hypothetical protein